MKTHSATIPLTVSIGGDELEAVALIDYTIRPGSPETGPSYASGGEPAEAAEIEILEVLIEYDAPGITVKDIVTKCEKAPSWLFDFIANSEQVYQILGDEADWGEDDGPDPDAEYERRRDDGEFDREPSEKDAP